MSVRDESMVDPVLRVACDACARSGRILGRFWDICDYIVMFVVSWVFVPPTVLPLFPMYNHMSLAEKVWHIVVTGAPLTVVIGMISHRISRALFGVVCQHCHGRGFVDVAYSAQMKTIRPGIVPKGSLGASVLEFLKVAAGFGILSLFWLFSANMLFTPNLPPMGLRAFLALGGAIGGAVAAAFLWSDYSKS